MIGISLIIAYIGNKGSVMAGDKRRIAFFGEKINREKLEEGLYSGILKTYEEFTDKAKKLNISYKITEDANKIKSLENALVGEVSTRTTIETKRKRIYATTNGYKIVKLLGSDIVSSESGKGSIIVFGNKITKSLANKYITEFWKSNVSLRFIGDIFLKVLEKVANETPSIGKKHDVLIQQTKYTPKEAESYLDNLIKRDIKLLDKFREKLKVNLSETNKKIQRASKIIYEGKIGKISNIENKMLQVTLNPDVRAFDTNWKPLVKPGGDAIMFLSDDKTAKIGDEVVIENETLCLKNNKTRLNCNIILSKV
ncbi:MAG: DUF2121 domain-containing protein [Methanobrevibacter sp.]|nr:DUF2121 domain-containing protein [Candidatus Methanovirga basalitermitum]